MQITSENSLESEIMSDPEWIQGAQWGFPRESHPEGEVIYHIQEVLENINRLPDVKPDGREMLRVIALIHDTFKHKVDITKPRVGDNNHAVIARKFAEKYVKNETILNIIEFHDEAFNAWRKGNDMGKWDKARERLQNLLKKLDKDVRLYYLFYICDNETGTKDQECLRWFEKEAGII